MFYEGTCHCKSWRLRLDSQTPLKELKPQVCDSNFCDKNPSRMISDACMSSVFVGKGLITRCNGDQLATFNHCINCNQLLAVTCEINEQIRGAVNANLLLLSEQLGENAHIQPRLLSANEKLKRWRKLWGLVRVDQYI